MTISGNLEKRAKSLEIYISKDMQQNRSNCIEFSAIPNTINDNKFEETIIKACNIDSI